MSRRLSAYAALQAIGACPQALNKVAKAGSGPAAWRSCDEPQHMAWVLTHHARPIGDTTRLSRELLQGVSSAFWHHCYRDSYHIDRQLPCPLAVDLLDMSHRELLRLKMHAGYYACDVIDIIVGCSLSSRLCAAKEVYAEQERLRVDDLSTYPEHYATARRHVCDAVRRSFNYAEVRDAVYEEVRLAQAFR